MDFGKRQTAFPRALWMLMTHNQTARGSLLSRLTFTTPPMFARHDAASGKAGCLPHYLFPNALLKFIRRETADTAQAVQ